MALADKLTEIKSETTSLLAYANEVTGSEDATLGDAILTLAEGYGSGGAGAEDGIIDRSITECSNNRVESIGNYAFYYCVKLTSVNFPNAISVGSYAFNSCTRLTSAYLPLLYSINNYAFYSCSSLTSVNFPNVTSIDGYAFAYCNKLTSVDFPNVASIGNTAFYSCSSLTSVDFPNVASIGNAAFYSCSSLTSVDFPNVASIGNTAFAYCPALTEIIIRNTTKVCSYSTTSAAGDPKNANLKIYVPRDLLESYKVATNWTRLADKFVALEDYTVDGTTTGEMNKDADGNIVPR